MIKTETRTDLVQQLEACVASLEDRKAEEIKILDVRGRSTITDYFILASGNSEPHLKALRRSVEEACDETGVALVGTESEAASGWVVIDAFDFMVHLFLPDVRDSYRLEQLWRDADELAQRDLAALTAEVEISE